MLFNDLYQEMILDHSKNPRNKKDLSGCPHCPELDNPVCGDTVKVCIKTGTVLEDISFDGHGCAIDTASASIMTEELKGLSRESAVRRAEDFIALMRGEKDNPEEDWGDAEALKGVLQFPARVKCATLPWHAFLKAVETTEKDITALKA